MISVEVVSIDFLSRDSSETETGSMFRYSTNRTVCLVFAVILTGRELFFPEPPLPEELSPFGGFFTSTWLGRGASLVIACLLVSLWVSALLSQKLALSGLSLLVLTMFLMGLTAAVACGSILAVVSAARGHWPQAAECVQLSVLYLAVAGISRLLVGRRIARGDTPVRLSIWGIYRENDDLRA